MDATKNKNVRESVLERHIELAGLEKEMILSIFEKAVSEGISKKEVVVSLVSDLTSEKEELVKNRHKVSFEDYVSRMGELNYKLEDLVPKGSSLKDLKERTEEQIEEILKNSLATIETTELSDRAELLERRKKANESKMDKNSSDKTTESLKVDEFGSEFPESKPYRKKIS